MNRNKIISINGSKVLRDLNGFDVVFGTKGNGRNEVFLRVLEDHSEQYKQLSKFQKMGLIQQLISNWRGNFYVLDSKTDQLSLVQTKSKTATKIGVDQCANHDHEPEGSALSGKLYTSVRRMMNYVIAKKQDRLSIVSARAIQAKGKKKSRAADPPLQLNGRAKKMIIGSSARSGSRKPASTKASIRAPNHKAVLVSPEPSPRTIPVASCGLGSQDGSSNLYSTTFPPAPTSITLPSTVLGSFASTSRNSCQGPSTGSSLGSARLQLNPADLSNNNGVNQLEVSAISALLSFSRSD